MAYDTPPSKNELELRATIEKLQALKRDYEKDLEGLSERHIGQTIRDLSTISTAWRVRRDLAIRALIYSVMNIVLDQVSSEAKLDELNDEGLSPLHVAVDTFMPDCLELLLAKGADPHKKSARQDAGTPLEYLEKSCRPGTVAYIELSGSFMLHKLLKYWQKSRVAGQSIEQISLTWIEPTTYRRSRLNYDTVEVKMGEMIPFGPWKQNVASPKFSYMWIHVPFISFPVLLAISRTIDGIVNEGRFVSDHIDVVWFFLNVVPPPVLTPSNPLLSYRDEAYLLGVGDDRCLCAIVFPCLVLDKLRNVEKRRERYRDMRQPLFSQLLSEGKPDLSGICLERTLDEAYFPSMDNEFFETRNNDQVLSKEYRRIWKKSRDDRNVPVLVVPQLWLWKLHQVLLSAYSMTRESKIFFSEYGDDPVVPLQPSLYSSDTSINLQVGVIIATQIMEFGSELSLDCGDTTYKPALHMFETAAISTLSEVYQYLDAEQGKYSIKEQKEKEKSFIHSISDIHSELDMIQSVLEQQKKVLGRFLEDTKTERLEAIVKASDGSGGVQDLRSPEGQAAEGWRSIEQARTTLEEYNKHCEKIHRDADRVGKTIESYLSLKRTYASIEDTRNSLLVGLAALAFAIVTVIFTPLSFMTSLFALPLRHAVEHQETIDVANDPTRVYKSWYIGICTAAAGLATWVPTITLMVYLYSSWTGQTVSSLWTSFCKPLQRGMNGIIGRQVDEEGQVTYSSWSPLRWLGPFLSLRWSGIALVKTQEKAAANDSNTPVNKDDDPVASPRRAVSNTSRHQNVEDNIV